MNREAALTMFDDLDWLRDLEWLRRLDDDLSGIIESIAQNQTGEARGEIASLREWVEASGDIRAGKQALVDALETVRTKHWYDDRPRAVTDLVVLRRKAHARIQRLYEEKLEEWPPVPHTFQQLDGRYWAPISISLSWLASALAVENTRSTRISEQLHHDLLESKIKRLFAATEREQQRELLEEYLPEESIHIFVNEEYWPQAVMRSDRVHAALARIDWERELSESLPDEHPSQEDIKETLDEETLWSWLERL